MKFRRNLLCDKETFAFVSSGLNGTDDEGSDADENEDRRSNKESSS